MCAGKTVAKASLADTWLYRSDADEVRAAVDYFQQAKSYRDTGDTALHAKHKLVLQDSLLAGERFATGQDALAAVTDLKQNRSGLR